MMLKLGGQKRYKISISIGKQRAVYLINVEFV